MASESERKFVTTLAFAQEIGRCINQHAMTFDGREWLKEKSLELMMAADIYLRKYNGNMGPKDIKKVEDDLDTMCENGLESCGSYQSYLIFLLPTLGTRRDELKNAKSSDKREALSDLIVKTESIERYYSSRIRHHKFEREGGALLDSFNEIMA